MLAAKASGSIDLIALDDALNRLAAIDAQQARIVELRFFSGFSIEDTADVLGISPSSVKRDWRAAKAWLRHELEKGGAS
ncbi:MAG TPA: ECF-type sigma factor, partial [Pyrinomonadaceae bacterium]